MEYSGHRSPPPVAGISTKETLDDDISLELFSSSLL